MTVAKKFLNRKFKLMVKNKSLNLKYLGGGVNGSVYSITKNKKNTGKLVKIVLGNNPMEFNALKILNGYGIAPRFHDGKVINTTNKQNIKNLKYLFDGYSANKVTVMIMNKVGNEGNKIMTLSNYINRYNPNWKEKYANLIKTMHRAGVIHGNLHKNNVIVSISNKKPPKFWAINFGRSLRLPVGIPERNYFRVGLGGMSLGKHLGQRVYSGRNIGGTIPNYEKAKKYGVNYSNNTNINERIRKHKYKPNLEYMFKKFLKRNYTPKPNNTRPVNMRYGTSK